MIGHMIILFWIFWVKFLPISIVAVPFFFSINIIQGLLFIHMLLLSCVFLIITILAKPLFVLTYISLMISDFKQFFIHLLAVVCLIWRNVSSNYLLIFNFFFEFLDTDADTVIKTYRYISMLRCVYIYKYIHTHTHTHTYT